MDPLPNIPIPLSTRWREFRTRVLPVMFALSALTAAAWLWRHQSLSGNFAGMAEGARAIVSSPQAGSIRDLMVQPFQMVQAGDPVMIVVPTDPRAALDVLQSELEMSRLSAEPSLAERNAMDYERLRFELLRTKSELAGAEVDLQRANSQVQRQKPLFEQNLLSEDAFDLTAKNRDSILAEVRAKSNAVAQMEERLEYLRTFGEPVERTLTNGISGLASSFMARHRSVLTSFGPITLVAPISGMISSVQRRTGEQILPGETIMVVNSPTAERVVGYMRQPYPVQPEIGMEAMLMTRELNRRKYVGSISQVGVQVESVTNSLAVLRPGALFDTGLPIVIDLPPDSDIRPGEIVDIVIRRPALTPSSGMGKPTVSSRFRFAQSTAIILWTNCRLRPLSASSF
jgi:multidrug resistance efflux pump